MKWTFIFRKKSRGHVQMLYIDRYISRYCRGGLKGMYIVHANLFFCTYYGVNHLKRLSKIINDIYDNTLIYFSTLFLIKNSSGDFTNFEEKTKMCSQGSNSRRLSVPFIVQCSIHWATEATGKNCSKLTI